MRGTGRKKHADCGGDGRQGILISNEIHPARAKILSENIERMGIANAVVTNETPQRLAEHFSEYFTRIMVDAPCSGEGMFRKDEEAAGQWSPGHVTLSRRPPGGDSGKCPPPCCGPAAA